MRQPTGAARTAGRDSSVRTGGMPCAAWPRRYGHRIDTWTDAEILRAERGSASGFCASCRRVGMRYSKNSIECTVDVHETRVIGIRGVWAGAAPRGAPSGGVDAIVIAWVERLAWTSAPRRRRCGSGRRRSGPGTGPHPPRPTATRSRRERASRLPGPRTPPGHYTSGEGVIVC